MKNMQCSVIVFYYVVMSIDPYWHIENSIWIKKKESESIQRVLITYMELDSIELKWKIMEVSKVFSAVAIIQTVWMILKMHSYEDMHITSII